MLSQNKTLQLLGIMLIGTIIYIGSSIIVPIGFSFLMSILLLPLYRFLKKIKLGETAAVALAVFIGVTLFAGVVIAISMQLTHLLSNTQALEANVQAHFSKITSWVQQKFGYSISQQSQMLQQQIVSLKKSSGTIILTTLSSLTSILVWFGLVPLYVYLILYYKNLLIKFVFLCSNPQNHDTVEAAIYDTESTLKSYLIGLLKGMVINASLLAILLFIFGIKYAILIAVIFALFNLIPYVGALVANVLAVIITLSSSPELWHVWAVLLIIAVVQLIDNNIIMSYVVASKVNINALVTIIAVVVGEALAGVGGMFLAIPTVAVLKVVFDKIDTLKHWGLLFGDDRPKLNALNVPIIRLKKFVFREKATIDDNKKE